MEAGKAVMRYSDNKGRREEEVPLHPVVIEHLRRLPGFGDFVFPWNYDERKLWDEFHRIQDEAGIHLPCREKHDHTDACFHYGFHDLRRAFATLNAETLSADALQALMRHKAYKTTQSYINMAKQLNRVVETLHVPEVLRKATG